MNQKVKSSKWLVCDSCTPIHEVAFLAVRCRFAPLPQLMRKAALEADRDIEHVHRLRVATRRASAAVNVFGDFLDPRKGARLATVLSQIRKAAGRARDLDVLIARHQAEPAILKILKKKRSKAQRKILQAYRDWGESGKLKQKIVRLWQRMTKNESARKPVDFRRWSELRLGERLDRVLQAWPPDSNDLKALHQLRIQVKSLRYTLELLASALPESIREDFYPHVEKLQSLLGRINDHDVALRRIKRWRRSTTFDEQYLNNMRAKAKKSLRKALSDFDARCEMGLNDKFVQLASALAAQSNESVS